MEATADLSMQVVDALRGVGQRLRSAITTTVEHVEDTVEHITREDQLVPTLMATPGPSTRLRPCAKVGALRSIAAPAAAALTMRCLITALSLLLVSTTTEYRLQLN